MDELRKAIELVLSLHDNKEANTPGYTVHLDPMAETQLRTALAHTANDAPFVENLRVLQHAANMLNYNDFLEATGWLRDDYSKHKFVDFQKLGGLHMFDDHTLTVACAYYLGMVAMHKSLAMAEAAKQ